MSLFFDKLTLSRTLDEKVRWLKSKTAKSKIWLSYLIQFIHQPSLRIRKLSCTYRLAKGHAYI